MTAGTALVRAGWVARPDTARLLPAAGLTAGLCAVGLLLSISPAVAFVLVGGLVLAAWLLARPDDATVCVIAVVYSNAAAIAVEFHGLPYAVGVAVPLVLLVPLAHHLVLRRRPILATPALPLMVGLLAVQLAGTFFASDTDVATAELVTYVVEGLGLYILVTNLVRTREVLRRVIWTLLAVGAVLGCLSAYQQLTGRFGNDLLGFAQLNEGDPFRVGHELQPRLAGQIGEVNRYAQTLLVLVPLGLFQIWSARSRTERLAAAAATVLITCGIVLTFSRGAAVGFAVVVLMLVALRYIRLRQLAVFAVGLAVVLAVVPAYRERLSYLGAVTHLAGTQPTSDPNYDSGNLRSRATEVIAAGLVFLDHPVLGVGPGMFPEYYSEYAQRVRYSWLEGRVEPEKREAHDLYTGIAAETGAAGLALFLAVVAVTLGGLRRARRLALGRDPELANIATAFMVAVAAYLATGIFLQLSYQRYFWLLMALAGAAASITLDELGRRDGAGRATATSS
jgi:O-antigen ligase